IEPGGPADQAGILEEDLILSLGEQTTTNIDDLHKVLTQLPIDVPAPIVLLRRDRVLNRLVLPTDYPMPVWEGFRPTNEKNLTQCRKERKGKAYLFSSCRGRNSL